MLTLFPLFPEQASTAAAKVDALYFFLLGVSAFFSILIFTLLIAFAVRYRRRPGRRRPERGPAALWLELLWSGVPAGLAFVMFVWGAEIYFAGANAPQRSTEIDVVARQWMWKFQHPEGNMEINELHVPAGRPFRLVMASEDVIHSFFVPAFRVKADVVPGRISSTWFEATRPGSYHLFCAQYCGTQHSGMIGAVIVMTPARFEQWLAATRPSEPASASGEKLFSRLGCGSCHAPGGSGRGPDLEGLFGSTVRLWNGQTVRADETYLRRAILEPSSQIVEGYDPVMPTYQGLVGEQGVLQLITYIKAGAGGRSMRAAR